MIKNIPNKYSQSLLIETLDVAVKGRYDFLYLPIDFKNGCNVGYAFINMTEPSAIVPLYETLHDRKWDHFNSGECLPSRCPHFLRHPLLCRVCVWRVSIIRKCQRTWCTHY